MVLFKLLQRLEECYKENDLHRVEATRVLKLPKSINIGLIKLIQTCGDVRELKNYPPLTMLNTIYKVMTKLRVRTMVASQVYMGQHGFVNDTCIYGISC